MKNVKKMIQAGLKKFTVITILGVFLMTSLIPVSAATKVSKIKWSAYRKTMYVGNAQRFAVKITPAKASKAKLGWKTSNKKIAKVSAKGVVTPVKAGKATITCYVKSQKSKKVTCKVTVKKQKVTAITFAKASVAVQKGKKVSNPAIVTPTYAANKKVTYKSSSTSVATVSTSGVVTGKKVGTATITAKIGDVTATCEVTVDFATGLEEALANTEVFGRKGNIYVNPIQSLQVTVVNMIGKIVYNARISSYARIPVTKGIYIVKLTNVGNTKVIKVNVY